ncbi:squamosa promoter-binding-like protein 13A [Andrographis paniculata]|uniref:squamosa promoter-binding-like protein 13A n=1 Tax=Andrographis paniculata TaxID=175694 RepID=UPI0021E91827|nr:squamosa promoter-binding-like protein 13A [Andrographis paniculata]XP_051116614.1 squamosa promoter-binding-like protein 13A [Andrographis paniculata]XP_051116615.1 squamosa promoter-binding-like protein 13A [Andrographis paniculata]XP_051116616.1 squamosa promoter-binding-like protein 13A [Andrographis paniculata]XP_051116617.1 squamosa promoter-binding-like protein 13A [Andrographis paniculata]
MEHSSFLGSSKRAKAPASMAQVAHCLVDGCNADLSLCREYHRRHKVCEIHSKTPKVAIAGREQRFCQQCSRFHSLVEFDDEKRSCRKRLDGHNRRRRKPQPDTAVSRNSGLIFSGRQSTTGAAVQLLSFANPHMLPAPVAGPTWPSPIVKTEHDITPFSHSYGQHMNYFDGRSSAFPECSSQFRFIQGGDAAVRLEPNVTSSSSTSGSCSNRALSLLSSAPPSSSSEFCNNDDALLPAPMAHLNLQFSHGDICQNPAAGKSKAPFGSGGSSGSGNGLSLSEMFEPEGPATATSSGPHQTLSFMWE